MGNPILQQARSGQATNNGLSDFINKFVGTVNVFKNPKLAVQSLVQNSPQFKQFEGVADEAMKYVQENGGDEKTAFYKLARQCGVNPDQILGMLQR